MFYLIEGSTLLPLVPCLPVLARSPRSPQFLGQPVRAMHLRLTRITAIVAASAVLGACASNEAVLPLYMPPPGHTTDAVVPIGSTPRPVIRTDSVLRRPTEDRAPVPVREPETASQPSREKPAEPAVPVSLDRDLTRRGRRPAGSSIPSQGVVRAIVLPVSLGGSRPTWSERDIAEQVFGRNGLAAEILRLSDGTLRLEADIFPPLVESKVSDIDIIESLDAEKNLLGLGRRLVDEWARRANLAQYDNDGPDGRPMSGDDDGRVDLLYVVIETPGYPALMTLPIHTDVPVGRGGRLSLRADVAHVIPLPPVGSNVDLAITPELRLLQFLAVLGVDPATARFPRPLDNEISTATRVQLGWAPFVEVRQGGTYTLSSGVLVLPVDGRERGRAWMVEHRSGSVLVSSVVRSGERTETLSVVRYSDPTRSIVLPLGPEGSRQEAVINWSNGSTELRIQIDRPTR